MQALDGADNFHPFLFLFYPCKAHPIPSRPTYSLAKGRLRDSSTL